jgi:hypothetical protein
MNTMDASYPVKNNKSRSVRNVVTNEIFKILEQYIRDTDKLLVDSIEHKSPGGVKFRTPTPIRKRSTDKPKDETPDLNPLEKTEFTINEIINRKSSDVIVKEIIVQNRTEEPELMNMFSDILRSPLGNLQTLINVDKIRQGKMFKLSKYGKNEIFVTQIT